MSGFSTTRQAAKRRRIDNDPPASPPRVVPVNSHSQTSYEASNNLHLSSTNRERYLLRTSRECASNPESVAQSEQPLSDLRPAQQTSHTSSQASQELYQLGMSLSNAKTTQKQKLDLINLLLRRSHLTFIDLVRAWLENAGGEPTGKARQAKARQLLDLVWDEDLLPLFEKTDTFEERTTGSATKVVRSELVSLQKNVPLFGKYDPDFNLEDLNFTHAIGDIEKFAPNLSILINGSSEGIRTDKHTRKEQPGRIVMIAAVLSLGRARQSANLLARALGVYLHTSGVRRRVISTLHGLGIVDSYHTIHRTIQEIAKRSQESISASLP